MESHGFFHQNFQLSLHNFLFVSCFTLRTIPPSNRGRARARQYRAPNKMVLEQGWVTHRNLSRQPVEDFLQPTQQQMLQMQYEIHKMLIQLQTQMDEFSLRRHEAGSSHKKNPIFKKREYNCTLVGPLRFQMV